LKNRAGEATNLLHRFGFTELSFIVYPTDEKASLQGIYKTNDGQKLFDLLDSDDMKRILHEGLEVHQIYPHPKRYDCSWIVDAL